MKEPTEMFDIRRKSIEWGGRKLTLEAGPKFTGDAEATKMITRDKYRAPYVV